MQKTTKFNSTKKSRFTLPLLKVIGIWLAAFAAASCSSFFESDVSMNSNSNNSSIYDLLTPPEKIERLSAPTEIFISQGLYSGVIEVSWSAVPNATSYKIERAVVKEKNADGTWEMPKESDFELLTSSNIYNTKYTDTIIQEAKYTSLELNYVYYYRVFAQNPAKGYTESEYFPDYSEHKVFDAEGNETGKEVYADPTKYGTLLKPVTEIEASKGTSSESITIKWNAVPDVWKYRIQRCEREQGNYYQIAEVYSNETEYVDEMDEADQGTEFYYKVYVLNSNNKLSCSSAAAMGYSLQPGAPTAPENIHVENGLGTSNKSLTVSWTSLSNPPDGGTLTYNLYRTSSNDSVYKLIKSGMEVTKSSYEDSSVKPGVYYYYFIQTTKTNGEEKLKSSFSETGKDSKNPAYGFLLSAPTYVEVDDGSDADHKKIIWSPAINSMNTEDAVEFKYNIYADSERNGLFDKMIPEASSITGTSDGNGNLYAEVSLADGKFFVITTVNENGVDKESARSETVAPVPEAPRDVYATKTAGLKTIQNKIAEVKGTFDESLWTVNKNEVYPVLITWQEPKGGADGGYDIYRSTKADSGFKKINTTEEIRDKFYVDSYATAKSGIMYFYKVVSLNSLGQGRKSNDPANDLKHDARGYGAITREQWFREYNKNIASSQKKLTLMHKPSDLDKVGSESVKGNISGTLGYNAKVAGLGAEITMPYTNYADHFISDDSTLGIRFILNGNTDTTSNMSANGHMHETVHCFSKEIDVTNESSIGNALENLSEPAKKAIINTGDKHYLCGMYPGYAIYDHLEIKGGAAGGGYYIVQTYELDRNDKNTGTVVLEEANVNWLVGEEK